MNGNEILIIISIVSVVGIFIIRTIMTQRNDNLINQGRAEDILCPVCGYYCLGNGGFGCIDKISLVKEQEISKEIDKKLSKEIDKKQR